MALDPTKVANKSTALVAKRTSAFEDVAADLNLAVLRLDETCPDPETAKQRARVAAAVLRGDDTQVRSALFDSFTDEQKRLIQQVVTGQLTEAGLDQQRQQAQQVAAPQQPQVVQGSVVSPSQEVADAVSTAKSKADAAATAATEAKTAANDALAKINAAGAGSNAAPTAALPVAGTP